MAKSKRFVLDLLVNDNSRRGISSFDTNMKRARRSAKGAQKSFDSLQRSSLGLGSAFMALGSAASIASLNKYLQQWQRLTNQLRTVEDTTEGVIRSQEQLFRLAQDSRQSLEATAAIFTRVRRASDQLNVSYAESVKLVDLINKSVAASGTTTKEAEAGIIQLAQAFQSGKLGGDELRSVMENLAPLARALSAGLGIPFENFRKQASSLSAEQLAQGILNSQEMIENTFRRTNVTISQSFQILDNAITRVIGRQDEAMGFSVGFANVMKNISDNINKVAKAFLMLGGALTALGAMKIIKMLPLLLSFNPAGIGRMAVAGAGGYAGMNVGGYLSERNDYTLSDPVTSDRFTREGNRAYMDAQEEASRQALKTGKEWIVVYEDMTKGFEKSKGFWGFLKNSVIGMRQEVPTNLSSYGTPRAMFKEEYMFHKGTGRYQSRDSVISQDLDTGRTYNKDSVTNKEIFRSAMDDPIRAMKVIFEWIGDYLKSKFLQVKNWVVNFWDTLKAFFKITTTPPDEPVQWKKDIKKREQNYVGTGEYHEKIRRDGHTFEPAREVVDFSKGGTSEYNQFTNREADLAGGTAGDHIRMTGGLYGETVDFLKDVDQKYLDFQLHYLRWIDLLGKMTKRTQSVWQEAKTEVGATPAVTQAGSLSGRLFGAFEKEITARQIEQRGYTPEVVEDSRSGILGFLERLTGGIKDTAKDLNGSLGKDLNKGLSIFKTATSGINGELDNFIANITAHASNLASSFASGGVYGVLAYGANQAVKTIQNLTKSIENLGFTARSALDQGMSQFLGMRERENVIESAYRDRSGFNKKDLEGILSSIDFFQDLHSSGVDIENLMSLSEGGEFTKNDLKKIKKTDVYERYNLGDNNARSRFFTEVGLNASQLQEIGLSSSSFDRATLDRVEVLYREQLIDFGEGLTNSFEGAVTEYGRLRTLDPDGDVRKHLADAFRQIIHFDFSAETFKEAIKGSTGGVISQELLDLTTNQIQELEDMFVQARLEAMERGKDKLIGGMNVQESQIAALRFQGEAVELRSQFADQYRLAGGSVTLQRQAIADFNAMIEGLSGSSALAQSRAGSQLSTTPSTGTSTTYTTTSTEVASSIDSQIGTEVTTGINQFFGNLSTTVNLMDIVRFDATEIQEAIEEAVNEAIMLRRVNG